MTPLPKADWCVIGLPADDAQYYIQGMRDALIRARHTRIESDLSDEDLLVLFRAAADVMGMEA